jgi:BirA family biotin operon repressor/biotin-[acetyl-CoA-carboxylase] ligase
MALVPDAVLPLLRGRFGRTYRYEERCESTQLLLGADAPEGAVVVCDFQSAGRGRLGRTWEAPPGTALQLSVLVRPPADRRPAELTLVAALALAETLEEVAQVAATIKWPNDVLLGGRKVAGILGEACGDVVVLGIGLNVDQSEEQLPETAPQPPTSLRVATGRSLDRAALLALLLDRLERCYDAWLDGGLAALRDPLDRRDFLRGRIVQVGELRGRAVDIDADGNLVLECDGERHAVVGGEVTYEP